MKAFAAYIIIILTFFGTSAFAKFESLNSKESAYCGDEFKEPFQHVVVSGDARLRAFRAVIHARLEELLKEIRPLVPPSLASELTVIEFRVRVVEQVHGNNEKDVFVARTMPNVIYLDIPRSLVVFNNEARANEMWRDLFVTVAHEIGHLIQWQSLFINIEGIKEDILRAGPVAKAAKAEFGSSEAVESLRRARKRFQNRRLEALEKFEMLRVLKPKERNAIRARDKMLDKFETPFSELTCDFFAGVWAENLNAFDDSTSPTSLFPSAHDYGRRRFDPNLTVIPTWATAKEPYFALALARAELARLIPVMPKSSKGKQKLVERLLDVMNSYTLDLLENGTSFSVEEQTQFLIKHLRSAWGKK